MIPKVIFQSENELTVELLNGKTFTVYSSAGDPINLMLDLLYRETSRTVGETSTMSLVMQRSEEETCPGCAA